MKIYSVADIQDADISPPQMIVENLLPVGLSVCAGSPKQGKSWLALSLAYAVAQGLPFLNHPTAQGDVLYIDLEGSPYRIKERMETLNYEFPQTLQIAHDANTLGNGLLDDLQWWWERATFPRLVIIDTISRLKSAGNKTMNAYENDSKAFAPLQSFALEKKIAIICITHLKKNNSFKIADADWMERISGSMGLVGCCDAVWALFRDRGSRTGYLRTTARDVDAGDFVLSFDDGLWSYVSNGDIDDYQFREKPIVKFLIKTDHFNGSATELYSKYLEFCENAGLQHGLSTTQPLTSFGKQMKSLAVEGWRINKCIIRTRTKDGVNYCINDT